MKGIYANLFFSLRKYLSKYVKLNQLMAMATRVASTETVKCISHPLVYPCIHERR